jgi:hypothetical protein
MLISRSKEEVATFAQARVDGATSGGRANKASSHEESLEAEANCFIINLKKKQDMADNFLSPLPQKIADVLLIIVFRQFWSRGVFFGTQALPKNRGAYVDDQNWHRPV